MKAVANSFAEQSKTPPERTALLVLGMHRSGTSALTRVASLLGADLPTDLMPPTPGNNDAGFWESLDVYNINDEILQSGGSRWDDWRPFNPAWFQSPARPAFEVRAQRILEQVFAQSPFFVFKDPRICRLLPFWLDLLAQSNVTVKCVLPVRNPFEVAASLRQRDGFTPAKSFFLWLRHVLDAELGSRGLRRSFAAYDALMNDWRRVVGRLSSDLDLAWPRYSASAEVEIDDFLDARHRHHAANDALVAMSQAVPDWVKEAHAALTDACEKGEEAASLTQRFDRIRADFDQASKVFGVVLRAEELLREECEQSTWDWKTRVAELEEAAIERETRYSQLEAEHARLERLEAESNARRTELEARRAELEAVGQRRDARLRAIETRFNAEQLAHRRAADLNKNLVHQLNRMQTAAWWPLAAPLRIMERRWPWLVTSLAKVPRLIWWTLRLDLGERLRMRSLARRLLAERLFDTGWYIEQNPAVVLAGYSPIAHWLTAGWRQGLDPNPFFDTDWYLERNPDARAAGIDPLTHYLTIGAAAGQDPGPAFDTAAYLTENPEAATANQTPLGHFLASRLA